MIRKLIGSALFLSLIGTQVLFAQQKRSLTHADYDGWESLNSEDYQSRAVGWISGFSSGWRYES